MWAFPKNVGLGTSESNGFLLQKRKHFGFFWCRSCFLKLNHRVLLWYVQEMVYPLNSKTSCYFSWTLGLDCFFHNIYIVLIYSVPQTCFQEFNVPCIFPACCVISPSILALFRDGVPGYDARRVSGRCNPSNSHVLTSTLYGHPALRMTRGSLNTSFHHWNGCIYVGFVWKWGKKRWYTPNISKDHLNISSKIAFFHFSLKSTFRRPVNSWDPTHCIWLIRTQLLPCHVGVALASFGGGSKHA